MSDIHRVVITGLGAVTPIGNNIPAYNAALQEGKNGIGPITRFDAAGMKVKLCSEVKDLNVEDFLDKKDVRRNDRFNQLALIAADEAIADSGLDFDKTDRGRVGMYISAGIGGLDTISQEIVKCYTKGDRFVSPFMITMMIPNMTAGNIAIKYGLHGASMSHISACASSTHALGEAFRSIKHGYHDVMIAGGSESVINKIALAGFQNMTALSLAESPDEASLPFDRRRNGFVLGEGAAVLVLESYEHAVNRGAKIYAEVLGYGATTDGYHITSPDPEGAGCSAAIRNALAEGGVSPEQVDYFNAHGTGTPVNDKFETIAVKRAFGAHAEKLAVNSTKSMVGHLLGGAGAAEAIATVLQMRDGYVHPTINLLEQDEECDLNVVKTCEKRQIRYAMSNSLGFGGHNACILLRKI